MKPVSFVSEFKVCKLQRLQQLPAVVSGAAGGRRQDGGATADESCDSAPSDWLKESVVWGRVIQLKGRSLVRSNTLIEHTNLPANTLTRHLNMEGQLCK